MGSIGVEGLPDQDQVQVNPILSTDQNESDDFRFRPFQVDGLASDQHNSPTGMRDEVLLLSWLIVLLRTREGGQINFDWSYKIQGVDRCLSQNAVAAGLQSKIQDVLTAISHDIRSIQAEAAASGPSSLLLSTNSLSQKSDDARDDTLIHIEIGFGDGLLKVRPVWHAKNVLPFTVTLLVHTFVDTVRLCISNPEKTIEDYLQPTSSDLDEIWRWNFALPPSYNLCMHQVISEQAQRFPEKIAITSWDGDLSYGQIEEYSTFVALSLKTMGVELDDVLPICFEKSRWTIVAVLAAMKAGATFALMDPSLPLARLQNMAQQVGAKMMLTSRQQYDFSASIMPGKNLLVVEEDTFKNTPQQPVTTELTYVPPSTLMYIIFTSGSTGTPKGVKISHETYTSSAFPRAKAVGYTEDSRVLDFASYAFDVSIDSMLLTLGNGGCLCIPSDEDRLNDINGVIRNMRVNYAGLTPSVARILDPDVIASLSGLGLGGEAVSARDVTLWGQETRIIIGYGPCECTIGCTVNSSAATGRDYISIGPGNGAAMWITHPDDHDVLMPVGAVGELLVEGPIVGQGYLNDPDKTAAAFIEDPKWLVAGHGGYPGRRGRLYKTGDLGKYDPDGSGGIVFVGRKDTQVKLRGQRVELGEIESQLKARLPSEINVIAEVIVPQGARGQPTLVAFIAPQSTKGHTNTELVAAPLTEELSTTLSGANAEISKVLPRYMVPTAYIPVNHIPVLISGKTDRKRLRQFGATVDLRQLDQGTANTTTRQLNDLEQRLQKLWGQVLKIDVESIRLDDNFFALGGDSLAAMKLVSACRAQGLDLSVISTFGNPTLCAMASVIRIIDCEAQEETSTFSMISQAVESACLEASRACGADQADVEDIYPCTPTQESLFTFSLKSTKAYVAQRVSCIPEHITLDAWKKAWEDVVTAVPILRTRLAQLQDPGLQQVILKENISWKYSDDLAQYLENDRKEKMNLGENLARYAIVTDSNDSKRYMVWTVHHVLYDGWSEPLILEKVSKALQGQHIETQIQIRDFVKYVRHTDEEAMQEFWRRELKGAVGPQFPRLPTRDFLPTPDSLVEHHISLDASSASPFTLATLIRAAWALVASQYSGSDDVVFGETLTGRDISLPGVESIVGPLIATLPIRIHVSRTSSVESYLQAVQQAILARTPYQHMGMQNIRKVSPDAQHACEAGTGLVIQPEPEYVGSELGFDQGDVVREALHFNAYPLMVACGIRKGGFRVCASFDSSLIDIAQMQRILAQLEMACLQLTKDLSRRVEEISCLPETELNQIWQWNQTPPLALDTSSGKLRADAGIKPGAAYPRAVIPWVCDPRNPSLLSPIGALGELWLEGAVFSADFVESPAWLTAGSSACAGRNGKLQSTGDIVQLQEDGSLVFITRKENVVGVQGHAVDIADVENHFTRQLPPTLNVAAAVSQSSADSAQELVLFVECPASEENTVDLMKTQHQISLDEFNFEATLCAAIPISLAVTLKKLDKFIRDSLPSYMVPSTYVILAEIPTTKDHNLLNQLASKISESIFIQLQEGFKAAWANSSTQSSLTEAEKILRSSWAKILKLDEEQIDVDDNFFRLGGDSVLAMKLVSSLRMQGHSLTVADIFQHMRLGDAAQVLKIGQQATEKAETYQRFSTLGKENVELFLSEIVRPKLSDPTWSIQDVSPVTDSQALDIRGTIHAPRTSIQYTMLYLQEDVDGEQLKRACNELVKTHDILRTIFIEHESTFFQVILNELSHSILMHQTDKDLEQYVTDLCKEDIDSEFSLGSSFLRLFLVESQTGQKCLVIGLSHAMYDGVSLPRLLQDLETLYLGGKAVDFEPFSKYMAQAGNKQVEDRAVNYWRGVLDGSSLSVLEGTSAQPTDKAIFQTKPVNASQPPQEITTASLLTAAWAVVLARRLHKSDVTFGSVTSGRNIDLPNVENIMGPCYQLTPVRVSFESQWTAMDLLRFVQRQSAESAAHDFLGFNKISKQCAQWSAETTFFDSIVHHQDWDDFDTMPFAGGSCRVEITNPHGDAASPMKAVSFVKEGQIHVGVVGSERDESFVQTILGELATVVEELVNRQSEPILVDGREL